MTLFAPLISFDAISQDELNGCLVAWGHKMGPLTRPPEYGFGAHGLRHDGQLVAVTAWNTLIRKHGGGMAFLPRATTSELSRVCAERPGLCRVAVRLWREFVFPALGVAHGHEWAISYQDAVMHRGDIYRHDGWVRLGFSNSGTDQRSGKKGRRKVIWGWHPDAAMRAAHQLRESEARAA